MKWRSDLATGDRLILIYNPAKRQDNAAALPTFWIVVPDGDTVTLLAEIWQN